MMYLVSACLLGINCRYDGGNAHSETVTAFLDGRPLLAVCPELVAGLGVPRPPCRFEGGDGRAVIAGTARIVDENGNDRTEAFVAGARAVLTTVLEKRISVAILNERSPSCGVHEVYIGATRSPGMGVLTALLVEAGIRVLSDEEPLD
jgi:uncharacterized protein YbbK (DUF523 family)